VLHAILFELGDIFILLGQVIRQEVIAIRLHRSHNRTVQPGVLNLGGGSRVSFGTELCCGSTSEMRTSGGLSPGRSENLNKSYVFAQISTLGKISYELTAVMLGLFGCLRELKSKVVAQASKEASISRI
jgi:hypothetical protein